MKKQSGFTLIETLIAIFILTLTVGGLLTLAANGYFSVRYARNQLTANNLLQEALEYIRNDRDTAIQNGTSWDTWLTSYTTTSGTTGGCIPSGNHIGCIVDPYTTSNHIVACNQSQGACPAITFYPTPGFYGYSFNQYPSIIQGGAAPYVTSYVRTITMQQFKINPDSSGPDQVVVTVTVRWKNGTSDKTTSQSILLTNWHL